MASAYRILATITAIIVLSSSSLLAEDVFSLDLSSGIQEQKRPEVSCELKVKEKYQYYEIDGMDVGQLRKQMKQNGTKWDDGKIYAALTSWDIRYTYDVFYENGKCSVKAVKTSVDILYQLPRKISTTDPQLTLLWDDYVGRLKEHEFGHKDIAVKAAAEINQVLASLEGFSSRSELDNEARRRADEKLRQLKDNQVHYDHETRHGETQGAILAAN